LKTSLLLSFFLFFFLEALNVYPQQVNPELGKVPFNRAKSHIEFGISNPAMVAYANDLSQDINISIPVPAGTPFTVLGNSNISSITVSMCKGGDGNYYLLGAYPSTLYLFDPGSGTCSLIGYITGMGDIPSGISYNPLNNTYYITSTDKLYSFDVSTLNAALIGAFSPAISGYMADLCFDENGTCYAYEVNSNTGGGKAFLIDVNTAGLTTLGYVGFRNYGAQGMSYDMETGTIYLSVFNVDTGTGQLRTMNKTTGYSTLVYDWGDQIAAFALDTQ
jgi:hypothetical protein